MKPQLLFWIPATLRLSFILFGAALMWWFAGPYVGIALGVVCMAVVMVVQLYYLYLLSAWLDDPDSKKIPNGWGAWTNVYSRLYKLRRNDEQNRAELSEWLTRFRQAMSLLPDGVVIMDDVLLLEWCNPAAETHLGIECERDKDRRITNLVRSPAFIDYVVLGRYQQPLTLTIRDRKLIVQIIPFEQRRQILVTHDVTEAERIDMMRRDFVANASHELRTPLTVINGFLEIAVHQPDLDPETRAAHLKLMVEQGRRMQNLVEDMLTLTRLESLDYPMRPERVDMRALLDQVLQDGRTLSGGRHTIEYRFEGPDLKGSGDELRSAFGNLVSNAVRYTPEHGTIRISWTMKDTGPQFAVQDTGIGISAEHISRLTERFYRVDKSRSRETQGTGLGLAIVKHVMLRHDATLSVDSVVDQGSTFTVSFPRLMAYES